MFQHIEPYAGDPILTLNEAFGRDPRAHKINLSIGIYFDDDGKLPVMAAVRAAEAEQAAAAGVRPYQPMEGAANYRQAVQQLLFGAEHEALSSGRVATMQTIGGSGGLKVGADFLKRWFPDAEVWVSDPTWDNHRSMFEGAGFAVHSYPYYDAASGGLRFDAMLAAFEQMPPGSIVLLHACCHNPTGVDLTHEQWQGLIPVIARRGLIPYVDIAYQGFGDGIAEDAWAIRALANHGSPISFFVASSFSKSFSLYGERCGGLSVVCPDAAQAELVLGQMKATIRRNYSSPPTHGGQVVARVLQTPALRAQWAAELDAMRERIHALRQRLHQSLTQRLRAAGDTRSVDHFITQRGMFSYTGLSPAQCDRLREEHALYLVRSGRMCAAGLNPNNVEAVAAALAAVMLD
jgi:aromatic-amino-acid transaminase